MIKYNSNTVSKWYDGILNAKKAYHGNNLIFLEYLQGSQPSYKLIAQYSDTSEYKVECNGSTTLSSGETQGHSSAFNTMTSAVIGDCVTEIGEQAFRGGSSLTSITIPDSVKVIGVGAFHTVTKMTHIDLPSGITTISDSSFRHMQALTAFTIPSGITTIPTWCFNDCTSLTSITIPSNITSLSANCFAYCTALKEVHFKSTTAPTIASNAFSNCTSLEKIYIPSCDNYDAYAAQAGLSAKTDLIYAEDDTQCKPYKSELSYLQKDASHLGEVDLGLPITSNFKVEIKFRYINGAGSQFFGETPQTGSDANDFRFFWSGSQVYFDLKDKRINGLRTTYLETGDTASADQVIELGNFYFKNVTKNKQVSYGSTVSTSGRNNFCAFIQTGRDYGKIYYVKIYDGSTLVGDFIPVISNDNKYTFYNKVTGTICTVNGTLTGA